jgi:hypothetical protein
MGTTIAVDGALASFGVTPDSNIVQEAKALFARRDDIATAVKQCYGDNINDPQMTLAYFTTVTAALWFEPIMAGAGEGATGAAYLANIMFNNTIDPNTGSSPFSQADCQTTANAVWSQWQQLLLRKSGSDSGAWPYPGGDVTNSPDIWLNGANPLSDPSQLIVDSTTPGGLWGADHPTPVNGPNNIYVRGQNLFPGSLGGQFGEDAVQVRLYFAKASVNFAPSTWAPISTQGGQDHGIILPVSGLPPPAGGTTPAPSRFFTSEAFVGNFPDIDHTCMVAMASTKYHPNPKPGDSNFDITQFLVNQPSAAWQNFGHVQAVNKLEINNLDDRAESFTFEARCFDVPAGTQVRLVHADAKKTFALDTGSVHVGAGQNVVSATVFLPAKYRGDLEVHVKTADGKPLPASARIDVRGYWNLSPGHAHHADGAALLARAGIAAEADGSARLFQGNFVLHGG